MQKCLIIFILLIGSMAWSGERKLALRRIVVFPIKSAHKYAGPVEKSWWSVRKKLTESQRFFVASKKFLLKKDVFQPRAELEAADAILLGRLLDAQLLVSTVVEKKNLLMRVYETGRGDLVWKKSIRFHPAIPIKEQVEDLNVRVMKDFISALPYQAFAVKDSLKDEVIYKEKDHLWVNIFVGLKSQSKVGDKVQFIDWKFINEKPLFMGGLHIEVFAEGIIEERQNDIFRVKLLRYVKSKEIIEGSPVRIPKEFQRLRETMDINENMNINPELIGVHQNMVAVEEDLKETKPLVSSLFFISSLALFLILAF